MPEKTEINVVGGAAVTPEYLTVLFGLIIYTAGYIAEVVRAGIQSVPYGQHEAAAALGLSRGQADAPGAVLPQALRVIIPPLTSQYLNLTKNSSLAVAVGYPDLVSISSTALNQTGRAIECIAVLMACYLTLSLITSALMNLYNKRSAEGALTHGRHLQPIASRPPPTTRSVRCPGLQRNLFNGPLNTALTTWCWRRWR
jgi:general L-amino acid transport system permease protein